MMPLTPHRHALRAPIVNSPRAWTGELLVERGAMSPALTRASVADPERSVALVHEAHRKHARRLARAIIQQPRGGG